MAARAAVEAGAVAVVLDAAVAGPGAGPGRIWTPAWAGEPVDLVAAAWVAAVALRVVAGAVPHLLLPKPWFWFVGKALCR